MDFRYWIRQRTDYLWGASTSYTTSTRRIWAFVSRSRQAHKKTRSPAEVSQQSFIYLFNHHFAYLLLTVDSLPFDLVLTSYLPGVDCGIASSSVFSLLPPRLVFPLTAPSPRYATFFFVCLQRSRVLWFDDSLTGSGQGEKRERETSNSEECRTK